MGLVPGIVQWGIEFIGFTCFIALLRVCYYGLEIQFFWSCVLSILASVQYYVKHSNHPTIQTNTISAKTIVPSSVCIRHAIRLDQLTHPSVCMVLLARWFESTGCVCLLPRSRFAFLVDGACHCCGSPVRGLVRASWQGHIGGQWLNEAVLQQVVARQ